MVLSKGRPFPRLGISNLVRRGDSSVLWPERSTTIPLCYTFGTRAGRASPEHDSSVVSNPVFEAVRASYACSTAFLQISTGDEIDSSSISGKIKNASSFCKTCILYKISGCSYSVHEIFSEILPPAVKGATPTGVDSSPKGLNTQIKAQRSGFDLETKKRSVRQRSHADRRGFVPKGPFLSTAPINGNCCCLAERVGFPLRG